MICRKKIGLKEWMQPIKATERKKERKKEMFKRKQIYNQ